MDSINLSVSRTIGNDARSDEHPILPGADEGRRRILVQSVNYGRNVWCVLGLPFDVCEAEELAVELRKAALTGIRRYISTPNVHFIAVARSDPAFRQSVLASDLSVADGVPIIWMARLLGLPFRHRVAGADLFDLMHRHDENPLRVYFFGGPPGAAEKATKALGSRGCGLSAAGYESPEYGSAIDLSKPDTLDRINSSRADFLVVALGAQKGQAWLEHNKAALMVPLMCHMGAVINFSAGTIRRAPGWMRRNGLEWLWRIREERHLWRRYVGDAWILAILVATKLLPAIASSRLHGRRAICPPAIRCVVSKEAALIVLTGTWCHENLGPLRCALEECTATATHLRILMTGVDYVDAAFLGLMLLAKGHFHQKGRLVLYGVSPELARFFHRSGAEFLLA